MLKEMPVWLDNLFLTTVAKHYFNLLCSTQVVWKCYTVRHSAVLYSVSSYEILAAVTFKNVKVYLLNNKVLFKIVKSRGLQEKELGITAISHVFALLFHKIVSEVLIDIMYSSTTIMVWIFQIAWESSFNTHIFHSIICFNDYYCRYHERYDKIMHQLVLGCEIFASHTKT